MHYLHGVVLVFGQVLWEIVSSIKNKKSQTNMLGF
jgi:hypothetical protein